MVLMEKPGGRTRSRAALRRMPEQPPQRTLQRPPEQVFERAPENTLRLITSQPLTHPLPRRETPDYSPRTLPPPSDRQPGRRPRKRSFSRKKIYRRRRWAALAILCLFVLAVVWLILPSGNTSPDGIDVAGPARAPVGGMASEEPARSAGKYGVSTRDSKGKAGERAMPAPPVDKTLYLTVPKLGRYDDVVRNDDSAWALDNGAIKLPVTGFPWQDNANTYIAGHALGYAGTESYLQFAELPNMAEGDEIFLSDANGTTYEYRVTEVLTVTPQDNWVTDPVAGKDMISLQTCVNPPDYDQRLVVRGERVNVETL